MLVGYARVSTMDQNPALQMDALRAAGCEKIYTEKASGSHRDRPQLKAAMEYLRDGDTLVVWKLSRLARSLTQVIKTASDIADRGIALKVLTQNIDTSTPEGRLFFHMTAAFDEFQRELIVENTRAGLKAAAKQGRRGGRPKAMNEQNHQTRRGHAQGHGKLPIHRRCHRSTPNRAHSFLPILPNGSHQTATRPTFRYPPNIAKSCGGLRTFVGIDP